MTPQAPHDPTIERLAQHIGGLADNVGRLDVSLHESQRLTATKVHWIQRQIIVVGIGLALILGATIISGIVLAKASHAADDARATNNLLFGCFTPGSQCAKASIKAADARAEQSRQTEFVLFWCSRSNPLPTNPTPAEVQAGLQRLTACVQSYYPTFRLPPKAAATPAPVPPR